MASCAVPGARASTLRCRLPWPGVARHAVHALQLPTSALPGPPRPMPMQTRAGRLRCARTAWWPSRSRSCAAPARISGWVRLHLPSANSKGQPSLPLPPLTPRPAALPGQPCRGSAEAAALPCLADRAEHRGLGPRLRRSAGLHASDPRPCCLCVSQACWGAARWGWARVPTTAALLSHWHPGACPGSVCQSPFVPPSACSG